ncbi:MAG: hypothetical protein FD183_204, partial [Chitinophagaceae bacterium]
MNATVKLIAAIVLFVSITAPNPSTAQANSKIQRENNLIEKGYQHIWVLDISASALERAKKRLGKKADLV